MSKIKVSELFYSIQGEGKYSGVPSIFLRTFGCNFRCPGFGLPKGEVTTEVTPIIQNITNYENYKDLPLVKTGCDSYAAVYTDFKDLSPMLTSDTIANNICALLPRGTWVDEHLVITGGEPLLGWQRSFPDLLSHDDMANLKSLTFETNGTQRLTSEFKNYLIMDWSMANRNRKITFSVSPKLSGSGEKAKDAIKPDTVVEYTEVGNAYLKFVVTSDEDTNEILDTVDIYRRAGFLGAIYLMPVGGVESVYALNNKRVAEMAMHLGFRYSDRLQVPLFKNAHGT